MTMIANLPASTSAYVRKQTLISMTISMAFSAAFFWLIFRNAGPVEVWEPDFFALDFLPQSGIASLMAALVPALQTRTTIGRGQLLGNVPTIRSVVVRALAFALLGLGLAGMVIGVLKASDVSVFPWGTAFAIKVAYGAFLGLCVTPWAVRAALGSDRL